MGPVLLWFALGYLSWVWDCSSSPHDPRWPSATGVFVVLLATRVPRFSVWGAALCGLVLDAAQGGPLGPRVIAGVMATALAGQCGVDRVAANWLRMMLVTSAAIASWLAVPVLISGIVNPTPILGWATIPSIALTTLSSSLIAMAIRRLCHTPNRLSE